jgi:hypothetical protein
MSQIEVQAGQVWKDADPRTPDRFLRIDRVENRFAFCTVLSSGKKTRIAVQRMKPGKTGYELIHNVEAEQV